MLSIPRVWCTAKAFSRPEAEHGTVTVRSATFSTHEISSCISGLSLATILHDSVIRRTCTLFHSHPSCPNRCKVHGTKRMTTGGPVKSFHPSSEVILDGCSKAALYQFAPLGSLQFAMWPFTLLHAWSRPPRVHFTWLCNGRVATATSNLLLQLFVCGRC